MIIKVFATTKNWVEEACAERAHLLATLLHAASNASGYLRRLAHATDAKSIGVKHTNTPTAFVRVRQRSTVVHFKLITRFLCLHFACFCLWLCVDSVFSLFRDLNWNFRNSLRVCTHSQLNLLNLN